MPAAMGTSLFGFPQTESTQEIIIIRPQEYTTSCCSVLQPLSLEMPKESVRFIEERLKFASFH